MHHGNRQVLLDKTLLYCFKKWPPNQIALFSHPVSPNNTLKGCASKNVCENNTLLQSVYSDLKDPKCCSDSLCNDGQSVTLSLVPILAPILYILMMWGVVRVLKNTLWGKLRVNLSNIVSATFPILDVLLCFENMQNNHRFKCTYCCVWDLYEIWDLYNVCFYVYIVKHKRLQRT